MPVRFYKGGIHPDDGKEIAKYHAFKTVPSPDEVAIPLNMSIGAPAKPIVGKGDRVIIGQKIAEEGGFVSACVHASIAGTVKGIEKRSLANGRTADCIVITNDGTDEEVEYPSPRKWPLMSRDEILQAIKDAGIVGMGGAGFPTFVKLSTAKEDQIRFVIANGAECEPYITTDYRRMMENPADVVEGLKIVLSLFPHARGIIAIEDNKKDAARELARQTALEERIDIEVLRTRYPQGAERQLIYTCTGKALNSKMLPADVGAVVDNVETLAAIYRAVALGRPVTKRTITISGDAIVTPRNFIAPIGMDQQLLIDMCDNYKRPPGKIISGGPMMGFAMYDTHVPVTKTTNAVTALLKDDVSDNPQSPCISCGRCVEVCPSRLIPSRVAHYARARDEKMFLKYNGMECTGCGCCSYICPAKRQLKQYITTMKTIVAENRRKEKAKT